MNTLVKLFRDYRTVGIVGNSNTAKSSLVLSLLVDLKSKIKVPVYCIGTETNLDKVLEARGLKILKSVDDVLDMKLKGSVIYIDEFAALFDVHMASKQTKRIRRFFNRLAHLNNYVVLASAEVNFWNKFMCSLVKAHLVKEIEFNNLVNGTTLKRKVLNIAKNTSEYRLEAPKSVYYVVTDDEVVKECSFGYTKELDSKANQVNPFIEKVDKKLDKKVEIIKIESKSPKNVVVEGTV